MEGVEFCWRSPCTIVENKHISACERKLARAARRRRMEIRRFKIMATSSVMAPADGGSAAKRMKLSGSKCGEVARECVGAVDRSTETPQVQFQVNNESKGRGQEKECASLLPLDSGRLEENGGASPPRVAEESVGCYDDFACPEHGMVSVCGRRREMEDAVAILPAFSSAKNSSALHFFGVYDGHGGSQAALYCKDRLHELLAEELKSRDDTQVEVEWQKAMSSCFNKVDAEVLGGGACKNDCKTSGESECLCEHTIASETVGTTAVVAVVGSHNIIVANCGDSRAVLCRDGVAVPLSDDHKPYRPDEMARIESAGGRVIYWNGHRVFGVLAMSRAIGDKYLKPYVISEPEVTVTERTDGDECLILASDGLWDVLSNEIVCDVARKCLSGLLPSEGMRSLSDNGGDSPSSAAASLLTKLAFAKGSLDNISVIVVDLKRHRNKK
uniref:protein-serine/threonine phosphatase n=1 Tax=Araucaria cunninghamii TaxID=56994 RepID=A0A0D6QVK3_ARACU